MDKVLDCSARAMARCTRGKLCAEYGGGHFIENSKCHQFNKQVADAPFTMGDRIRVMNDGELARFLQEVTNLANENSGWFCQNKKECNDILSSWDGEIPDEWCTACMVEALQQPAESFPWEVSDG